MINKKRQYAMRQFFIDLILKHIHKCKFEYPHFVYILFAIEPKKLPLQFYPTLIDLTKFKNIDISIATNFILQLTSTYMNIHIKQKVKEYLNFLINKRLHIKEQLHFYQNVQRFLTDEEKYYYDAKFSKKFINLFV